MKVIVLANTEQKEELTGLGQNIGAEVIFVTDPETLGNINDATACIDLLFDNSQEQIKKLNEWQFPVIIVNAVVNPLTELNTTFVRINGWPTFLKRPVIEAAGKEDIRQKAEQVFALFNKKIEWVADIPGFISARVIASIINEAYFAVGEEVSSKDEIDTAMKLGTNYPYGPFEWCKKIGIKNIFNLLTRLSKEQKRYEPATLLTKEASV